MPLPTPATKRAGFEHAANSLFYQLLDVLATGNGNFLKPKAKAPETQVEPPHRMIPILPVVSAQRVSVEQSECNEHNAWKKTLRWTKREHFATHWSQ